MPENWKTYKLEDLVTKLGDGIHGTPKYSKDGQYYFINGNNLIDGKIVIKSETKRVSREEYLKHKRELTERTLLVSINGTIGKTAYYQGEKVMLGKSACYFNVKEGVNKKFIKQVISSKYFIDYLESNYTGSVIKNVSLKSMRELPINLPPLQEQKSIASILSALDDKIELNLQMNKTLEEMAMALYKHWFVDFGAFQEGEFVDSELGEIPKGWKNAILGDLINLNPRLSLPKGSQASFVEMKVLPIDVMSVSDVAQKEFKGGAKFQNGDTLFARITPCLENGKTAFVDFLEPGEIAFGSTEFLVMRAKEGVSKYWTYCLARDTNFRNFAISTMVGTSGRQRVQNDPFLSYEIPQPPKEVFESFSEIAEPWFTQIRINTTENQTLTQLRDTLLPKLISGEVRVKDVEKTLSEVL